MLGNKHRRCEFKTAPAAPFPVKRIPARDLRRGMTLVALPGRHQVTVCCGHWPVIADRPRHVKDRPVGAPYVSWNTDEPGRECGAPRSRSYWAPPDSLVTVASGRPVVRR
jgi:hypothetical protein